MKVNYPSINKESAQAYLKKVIGRAIRKLTTGKDVIALISIIGELVKEETKGRWFLIKRYGVYNPVYEPSLITSSGDVFLISSKVMGKVKWKVSDLELIFNDVHSKISPKIKWDEYSKARNNLVILE